MNNEASNALDKAAATSQRHKFGVSRTEAIRAERMEREAQSLYRAICASIAALPALDSAEVTQAFAQANASAARPIPDRNPEAPSDDFIAAYHERAFARFMKGQRLGSLERRIRIRLQYETENGLTAPPLYEREAPWMFWK